MAIRIRRAPAVVAALALAAVLALVAVLLVRDDDGTTVHGGDTTTTTTVPATTTTTAGTTTTTVLGTSTAVWPWASSGVRYVDPVSAARGFAVDFIGFTDPVLGDFRQGDARSGEVEVRDDPNGVATTVFVRQLGPDDSWWVLGSASPNIVVDQPAAGDRITSPVHVSGRSRAFEAQVDVAIYEDGNPVPLGSGYVMGSGGEELGPFAADHAFTTPHSGFGALVFTTLSAKDGHVWEASVLRVRLGVSTETTTVNVFFTGADGLVVPVPRVVPKTTAVLRAAFDQLVLGPTPDEQQRGLHSWFSAATAGIVHSVDLDGGHAVVDLADLRQLIPNASTSAGSQLLLSQMDSTAFQFPNIQTVEYRMDGSCQDFFEFLQMDCAPQTRG